MGISAMIPWLISRITVPEAYSNKCDRSSDDYGFGSGDGYGNGDGYGSGAGLGYVEFDGDGSGNLFRWEYQS